ncbi:thiol-disulfide isomerase/thioredoxin [Paraburkholderia sp. BL6669N2]|uniref:TlpA disulfide reductase family protein n=1 Tax=Paraburkholderia sp. BL6669N2 TaxID=1938807 RepID=UPI000E22A007|nr:TlpA disulfide reductase family protein [Paraburkholderia sp. BL6669N2]REG49628.1 thiol-disulfide isomerase/thioredoxin [Paraburkholderia sp. BL6669N2]
MNAELFPFPVAPLILFCSIITSLTAGWLYGRRRVSVDTPILVSVAVGLLSARISFVMRYLPAYRKDFLTVLDIRDLGFDLIPGIVAGGCLMLWYFARQRSFRGPLLVAIVAGATVWIAASAVTTISKPPQSVPAVSLLDVNGEREPVAGRDGHPTVLNLWATWCAPCQAEMPLLAEAQASHQDINIVFVNQGETHDRVFDYLDSHGLQVKHVLLDPGLVISRAISVSGYPTTLFYDSKGNLLGRHVGPFSRATFADAINQFYSRTETRSIP